MGRAVSAAPHRREQVIDVGLAEGIATGAPGPFRREERMPKPLRHPPRVRLAPESHRSTQIAGRLEQSPTQSVEQRTGGPGVKGQRSRAVPLGLGPGEHRPVRDAPEVEDRQWPRRLREENAIHQAHQRRALPARGTVTRSEVRDNRHAAGLGHEVPIADLQRDAPPPGLTVVVEDRLPVTCDQGELPDAVPVRHRASRGPKGQAKVAIEGRELAEADRSTIENGSDPGGKARLEGFRGKGRRFYPLEDRGTIAADPEYRPSQDHVDPVRGGAGEHPRHQRGLPGPFAPEGRSKRRER